MIINKNLKYVFISTPKAGTHTLFNVLQKYFGGEQLDGPYHRKNIPESCKSYFKFSTVRNPYERAVSTWHALTRLEPYRDIYLPLIGSETFEGFITWLVNHFNSNLIKSGKGVVLLEPQSDWLKNINLDVVLKIENISNEFSQLPFVDKKISIPKLLARKHESWDFLKNKTIEQMIYSWAKKDFENFAYSRDIFYT
ncbi:MAG: sulfotransferase family protein [bacterium]|nr:sulfotransferase family protein [bacterium]